MGLMETLFGPDGVGGQPGLVGKAGNAVWQGTGELGADAGLGETVVKSLGNIPHLLTDIAVKNPLEILKNPSSVLNDRGEISITRLLFPDYRREAEKTESQEAKARDAYTAAAALNTNKNLLEMFFGPDSGMSPAEGKEQAVAAGVPVEMAEREQQRDYVAGERAGQARQFLTSPEASGGLAIPSGVAQFVSPEQVPQAYFNAQRDKALASERDADNKRQQEATDWARKPEYLKMLEEHRRVVASGDQTAIALSEAALEKSFGKSSGQVTVVRTPDGGEVITGSGEGVSAFGSQNAKDRALARVDALDGFLDTIGEMRTIATKNPEAFGAASLAGGFAQNVAQQGKAFAALRARVSDHIAKGGAEPEVGAAVAKSFVDAGQFNEAIPQRLAMENTLAYAYAISKNDGGKISDSDFRTALETIRGGKEGSGEWMGNAASTVAVLDVLEREAMRERTRSKLRAGKPGKEKSRVTEALDRERGVAEPKPKLKDRKKGKKGEPAAVVEDYPTDTKPLPTDPKERSAMAAQLVGQDRGKGLSEAEIINRLKARGFTKEDVLGIPR